MPQHDARVDAYIASAAPFARPILERLRAIVHEACPGVDETIKWSMPHFMHAGRILAGMAAFKQHAAFHVPLLDADAGDAGKRGEAMGHLGRLARLADLPARRTLLAQLRKAVKAIDGGAIRARDTKPKAMPAVPADFARALARSAGTTRQFDAFPPGKRREYLDWILDARQAATRERRIAQAVEWIAEGKARNWKYRQC